MSNITYADLLFCPPVYLPTSKHVKVDECFYNFLNVSICRPSYTPTMYMSVLKFVITSLSMYKLSAFRLIYLSDCQLVNLLTFSSTVLLNHLLHFSPLLHTSLHIEKHISHVSTFIIY